MFSNKLSQKFLHDFYKMTCVLVFYTILVVLLCMFIVITQTHPLFPALLYCFLMIYGVLQLSIPITWFIHPDRMNGTSSRQMMYGLHILTRFFTHSNLSARCRTDGIRIATLKKRFDSTNCNSLAVSMSWSSFSVHCRVRLSICARSSLILYSPDLRIWGSTS